MEGRYPRYNVADYGVVAVIAIGFLTTAALGVGLGAYWLNELTRLF